MTLIIYVIFGALVAGTVHVDSIRSRIIDAGSIDIERIAEFVCDRYESYLKQISRISTVSQIAEYLKSLPEDHRHIKCSQKSLAAIEELRDFLDVDTNNVCTLKKISRAEEIHRRYVVKSNLGESHLPFILQIFFYHYMYMMSSMCSVETHDELLKHMKNSAFVKTDLDDLISPLAIRTTTMEYKDIYLFWNLVDRLRVKDHQKVSKYINDEHSTRITVGVKKTNNLRNLQNICRTQFKPLYTRTLLSTLRLINMGYYPKYSLFLDLLHNEKQARRIYELTKVCEALLPIRVVELSSSVLDNSNLVILSKQEVEQMSITDTVQPEEAPLDQCRKCSVVVLDKLPTVLLKDSLDIAMKVDSGVGERRRSSIEVLENLINKMKPGAFSKLFNRAKKDKIRKFLDPEMDKSMSQLEQLSRQTIDKDTQCSNMIDLQQGQSGDTAMYFLSFVWWFLSSQQT